MSRPGDGKDKGWGGNQGQKEEKGKRGPIYWELQAEQVC